MFEKILAPCFSYFSYDLHIHILPFRTLTSSSFLQFPKLHQDGVQNIFFSWPRILGWMINGVCNALVIYYFTTHAIFHQAFRQDGHVAAYEILGVTMYTCVVWTVNCQLAIYLSYFTWIQHCVIWGSIIFWYMFLVVYGSFPSTISTTAYWVFREACASSPLYWLVILLVVVSALLPYFMYSNFQKTFFPKYHDLIQRLQVQKEN